MTKKIFTALGLMSGTSCDGIDLAIIKTDGHHILELGPGLTVPYPEHFRRKLINSTHNHSQLDMHTITSLEREVTLLHHQAVLHMLASVGVKMDDIDIIGFHGHTLWHKPEEGATCQIGNGQLLAHMLNKDVVYDFRKNDMQHGGQGAPIAPIFHKSLAVSSGLNLSEPAIFLNIGGVANITYVHNDTLIGFDTGTGNALIDDLMLERENKAFDEGGKHALKGRPDMEKVMSWLEHPYFLESYPKSLDRNMFANVNVAGLSLEDAAATLAEYTVQSILVACEMLPERPKHCFVCGGGSYNGYMMKRLNESFAGCYHMTDLNIKDAKIDPSLVEAQAFAFLAARSTLGLPLTYATTTGVKMPSATGGVFCQGDGLYVEESLQGFL